MLKIVENMNVVVATYEFRMYPVEDWENPRPSLKLKSIELLNREAFGITPFGMQEVENNKSAKQWMERTLDRLTKECAETANGVFGDIMYKRVKFSEPLPNSSALMQYFFVGDCWKPEKLMVWRFVPVAEFEGFFREDAAKGFGFEVIEDE